MANDIVSIVQRFCGRTGLRKPSQVAGSLDAQVTQILDLANELCEDITDRWLFQELIKETTFTSVGTQDQGLITTIAPEGFMYILQDTIYDRTQKIPIYGPLSPSTWQQAQAFVPVGPIYRYRFRGGHLLFDPVPPAGHTCAFEYASNLIVYNPVDDEYKTEFTKDTDTFILDPSYLLQGLRWKWKCEKGLQYAEDMRMWESTMENAGCRSGSKPKIYMDGSSDQAVEPMIIVPPGSWPLS